IEQHKPDIVLLSETKLTNKHYIFSQTHKIIRSDRPNSKQGGGTAIMVKNNISHQIIRYPASSKNELLEYTIIQLFPETQSNYKIFIISVYATNSNKKVFINELNDLLQRLKLDNPEHFFVLGGDLNARRTEWGDYHDNQRGKYLRKWEAETLLGYNAKIYSKSIKLLHAAQNSDIPNKKETITRLKSTINLVKTELRKEFNKSSERYWTGQLKQINHRDPTAFFPKINRLLRKKRLIAIEDQLIKAADLASLSGAIDVNKAIRIDEEYLINDPIDKLNVIGEFYQTINAPRYLNTNTRLKEIVDEKAEKAKETLTSRRTESSTFVAFSDSPVGLEIKRASSFKLKYLGNYAKVVETCCV
ncbi:Protein of unknown function, partial [Cotesia congregata]